ncbi:MAG TPA: hypothetical protein VGF67_16125 [Ktedonobacteraceae bacterium]
MEQGAVTGAQLLAQPEVAGQGLLNIKAIRLAGIKHEAKAELDDQQRMAQQKTAQLSGGKHAFTETDQEGFQIGAFRMSWAATRGMLGLPLLDHRPVEQGKEGTIVQVKRVMITHGSNGRLAKEGRCRYHSTGLLL